MNDEKTTLPDITAKVDALWSARVGAIRKSNEELQPLIYAAWTLFGGRKGTPEPGTESFSGWLEARRIPRRTGYNILNRERTKLGELNVPVAHSPVTEQDEELDVDDAQEAVTVAQNGPVAASVASGNAVASPPARAPYKPLTPAELKTKRAELEKQLVEAVGKEKAQQIIDKCVVDHLTVTLNVKFSKKTVSKENKALIERLKSSESWQEAA